MYSQGWEPLIRHFVVAFFVSHTQLLLRLEHLFQASGMECPDFPALGIALDELGKEKSQGGGHAHLYA